MFLALLANPRTAAIVVDALVLEFENAESWNDAKWKFQRLNNVPALTEEHLRRIEDAYFENGELNGAFYVQDRIEGFLRRHWENHGVPEYHMRERVADDDVHGDQ